MKYLSLFSGYGGFELGIGDKGECIGFSEIDKYAIQVYKKHFSNHKEYGDITKINPKELPDFDLICGGFPCQAFSIAGKRGGFSDTRGTLFFEVARIVEQKRPRFLLLENVKGLLSHDNGRTFFTIISTLDELGYDCQWQVLNSKNFGVPQNRERVFIVGHLRGTRRPEVFPIGTDGTIHSEQKPSQSTYLKSPLRSQGDKAMIEITRNVSDAQRIYSPEGIGKTLKSLGGGQGAKTGLYAVPVLTPDRKEKRQNGRRFKEDGDPSFTVTAQDRHGVFDGTKIRRLTPTECERLMGLPDEWTSEGIAGKISDSQRYKLCGNGVVVNVVEEIIRRLIGIK
jgi:DNA (cytosine-5)-methyltransferase 1